MTDALPILVDCIPYAARLREAACVDRWRQANGVTEKTATGIDKSSCNGCEVGQERSRTGGNTVKTCSVCGVKRERLITLPKSGKQVCRKCRAARTPKDDAQKTIFKRPEVTERQAAKVEVIEKPELPPVLKFAALLDELEGLAPIHEKQREQLAITHASERAAIEQKLIEFEKAHPDIRGRAEAMLNRIARVAPAVSCPVCAKPEPCVDHPIGAPRGSQ